MTTMKIGDKCSECAGEVVGVGSEEYGGGRLERSYCANGHRVETFVIVETVDFAEGEKRVTEMLPETETVAQTATREAAEKEAAAEKTAGEAAAAEAAEEAIKNG